MHDQRYYSLIFILIIYTCYKYSLANSDQKGCLYGWQLNEEDLCTITCFSENENRLDPYCRLNVLKNLEVTHNQTSLSMSAGKILSSQSKLPSCQHITLMKHQFKIASNGQLDIGARYFSVKDYKMSEDLHSVSFCYPLSPQLLQCDQEMTDYNDYWLINSIQLMTANNITSYLGDFYIMENGSAVTCQININSKIHYIDMPRCNYLTVDKEDIVINNDGSAYVYSTNFSIKNPIYSIITSINQVQVCFPLSLKMRNCSYFESAPPVFFDSNKNLSAYSLTFNKNFNPDEYFITSETVLYFCASNNPSETTLQMFFFYKSILSFIASSFLVVTVIVKRHFFARNYYCKAMWCHILAFILYLLFYGALDVMPYSVPYSLCYFVFSLYYYSCISLYAWLSVISYDSWKNISQMKSVTFGCSLLYLCTKHTNLRSFIYYNIFAWGVPAILLTITLSMNLLSSPFDFQNSYIPYIQPICFITTARCYSIYVSLPLSCFTLTAIMFVILTILGLRQASKGTELVNQRITIQIVLVSVRIVFIMGLNWVFVLIFDIVTMFQPKLVLFVWFVGSLTTVIQGFVLAAFYFPCKKSFKVTRRVITKICQCSS